MNSENKEFTDLLDAIRYVYGYDFTDYSEASVKRRINNFMTNRKIETIDMLGKVILKDERLFEEFIQDISVTVTEMFRYPFIKIWIAGCATGEEVYSIAMLFKEEGLLNRTLIYATDINQKSLQIAKEGVYPLENMKQYTSNYQKAGGKMSFSEYYIAKYNSVLLDKSLKQNIVFAAHNLAIDKSFNEFQLIICRNVLIYFNQKLQNNVINLFYESLCPFGFLGLGNKESLLYADKKKHFQDVDRNEKIFMKNE